MEEDLIIMDFQLEKELEESGWLYMMIIPYMHFMIISLEERKKGEKEVDALTKDDFKTMSVDEFLALSDNKLNTYLKSNRFELNTMHQL